MKILKLFFICFFVSVAHSVRCEMLRADDYLDMVAENNSELKSVQLNINAVKEKLAEVEKVYSYYLKGNANYSGIWSENAKIEYDAAINKQFKTGTHIFLGLNCTESGESALLSPFIGVQLSLWKDLNGSYAGAVTANRRAMASSALYLLEYKRQNILLGAKLAYWTLSYSRRVVDFRKLSLERARKILDWSRRKYSMDLLGKSDLLQAQAAVKSKEMSLELACEDENRANRLFNQFLNIKDENVKYEVEKFESRLNDFKYSVAPEKKSTRADVLSSFEDVQAALYAQVISEKSLGADLVLKGNFRISGFESTFKEAVKHIMDRNKPAYAVSLEYTLPLDFKLRKNIGEGYKSARIAAQKSAESAVVKENNDWLQLLDDWNSAKTKFELAVEIEKIQQQKYQEDKNLLDKGRTTTHLVLQSEQALDEAAICVLQSVLELIRIYEQAQLYSGNVSFGV
jgi:outer membrane protein TolC